MTSGSPLNVGNCGITSGASSCSTSGLLKSPGDKPNGLEKPPGVNWFGLVKAPGFDSIGLENESGVNKASCNENCLGVKPYGVNSSSESPGTTYGVNSSSSESPLWTHGA